MNSANREESDDLLKDVTLDDGYTHVLVEYDQGEISVHELIQAIETTGTRVLETTDLNMDSRERKSVAFKLDISDVREIILKLVNYPLTKVRGYESKLRITSTGRGL